MLARVPLVLGKAPGPQSPASYLFPDLMQTEMPYGFESASSKLLVKNELLDVIVSIR